MSMQYWPRGLAIKMGNRLGFKHELQKIPNNRIEDYLNEKISKIKVQEFLNGLPFEVEDVEIENLEDTK